VPSLPESGVTETIGQRLRRLRAEKGLSQRELAEPGVSYAYISRIEAGTRQPSVKALRKLARRLGVSADYLETGSEVGDAERREMLLADAELQLRLGIEPDAAETVLRELLADALDAGDRNAATRARLVLGSAAVDSGRPLEAVALLEEAVRSGEVLAGARSDVYAQLGRAYALLGDNERATELFESCLNEVAESEPENQVARVRYATLLSYALMDADEHERAQAVLTDILEHTEELHDLETRIRLYWSLARATGMRGQHTVALDYARRALALVEATEDTVGLGRAHLLCGVILSRQGRAEEATAELKRAERLLGPRPAAADLAYLRTEQAKCCLQLGAPADAAQYAREALDTLGDTEPAERGAAWLALAQALTLQGEQPAAIEAYRRATGCLEQAGKLHDAAEAYRSWGRMLRTAGRESEALDALDHAADLAVRASRTEARVEA
jgi:transcriptional regulator with XRE-family HTH domain